MNRDETVELFLKGREAWNAWAEARLAERKAMEADGRWSAEKGLLGNLEAKTDETRAWMESAAADFSRCLFLVRGAEGTKETAGEDKESSEGNAPPVKSIQLEADRIDFGGFIFPGDARFESATFTGDARFESATFTGDAWFESATFTGNAWFESATFTGDAWFESATFTGDAWFESATFTGDARFESATFTGDALFESATFTGDAWFRSATFTGDAWFESATFTGDARFESATFTGDAWFRSATFTGDAGFESATFTGDARFKSASFTGDARFESATFTGAAVFASATFSGNAWFRSATFTGNARFESATFTGNARFESATFTRDAWFKSATFTGAARFASATFSGNAWFRSATFTGYASFESATFTGDAWFKSATFTRAAGFASATFTGDAGFRGQIFTNDVFFNGAKFGPKGTADFGLATFERVVQFDGAAFEGKADFNAVWGKRTFSMAGARFEGVPDFIQAHFEEAPRLDNVRVKGRKIAAEDNRRDMPARWRALKRLAIQACDQDREHAFFAGEVRSARLAGDWPLPFVPPKWEGLPRWLGWINRVPFVFWRPEAWAGFFRFWAGWAYEIFSDFGRSLLRPLLFWLLVMSVATVYFLGESVQPPGLAGGGVAGAAQAYARPGLGRAARSAALFRRGETRRGRRAEDRCRRQGRRGEEVAGDVQRAYGHGRGKHQRAQGGDQPFLAQRLHRARRRRGFGASHLWLPLWRRALWRQSGDVRAKQRRAGLGRAEAAVGAVHLPVRPRAAQYAEDEVTPDRVECFAKTPSPCPSPQGERGRLNGPLPLARRRSPPPLPLGRGPG